MKFLFLLSLSVLFVACSGSKSSDESMDAGIELADAVEFTEESGDVVGDSMADPMMDPMMDPMAEPVGAATMTEDAMADTASSPVEVDPLTESPVAMSGEVATYTVKENETLMMVAFNIYGDYSKWREVANMNQDKLNGSTVISKGMELKYNAPAEPFVFNPSGNPYLIIEGDTLGKISNKTYGKPVYWKQIWDNNKPLIKNPNVIFAGFTIYTPMIEGRDVAFDQQYQ